MSRFYPNTQGSLPPPVYYGNDGGNSYQHHQYGCSAAPPPFYNQQQGFCAPSYTSTMRSNRTIAMGSATVPPPTYFNNQQGNTGYGRQQQTPPTYLANTQYRNHHGGPQQIPNLTSTSVSIVPFVVPALTPAASSAVAAIKPSHQVLIMKPLPAFLTEDEDLLTLAKQFVVPLSFAEREAAETQRILQDGDEAVLARIREIKARKMESVSERSSVVHNTNRSKSNAPSQSHCNYLPFAAKVIRKSVLSAVTAALQKQQQQRADNLTISELACTFAEATTAGDVMSSTQCFCEEGYGFLLFATEEAGLTYLRAAEKLARQDATTITTERLGVRPSNVDAVRRDYDEIDKIKRGLYEDDIDEEMHGLNASYSSSISSSSCDSATSFDSQSSFESLASDNEDDMADFASKDRNDNRSTSYSCDGCTANRRMYRTYYRAQMNKRSINAVKIRCGVIVDDTYSKNADAHVNTSVRPATFNGVPLASKEHVAEMRALFANCFFNTVLSVAGADGTIAAKVKTKSALHSQADGFSQAPSNISESPDAAPQVIKKVVVHRPVLINCSDAAHPSISFMRATNSSADNMPTSAVISVVSEDLSRFATAIADAKKITTVNESKLRRHHTHHRHCTEHRPTAAAKRIEIRRNKALQTKIHSRTLQTPHVVNIAIPLPAQAARTMGSMPPAYKQPVVTCTESDSINGSANAPLITIDETPDRSSATLMCPSPCASTTMMPTHSVTNSIGDADGFPSYVSSTPTPTGAVAASPSASITTVCRRFRHNPYGPTAVQTSVPITSIVADIDNVDVTEEAPIMNIAAETSVCTPVSSMPGPSVSRENIAAQQQHQQQQGGLAAYLPAWAQQGGTGLQDAANTASARLRNMLSMSKVKRF